MYEIKNDGFYDVLAKYPDCIIDYFLIANDEEYNEIHSHRKALLTVVKKLSELFAEWEYDISCAEARKKEAKELLSLSDEPVGISSGISYYRAFLKPPHGNNYTDYGFLNMNNSLFPNGTECVVFYEWTTNQGKFCQNCGKPRPQGAPLYKCDKCGWTPEDPMNPPKFCPECGDIFDDSDKQ